MTRLIVYVLAVLSSADQLLAVEPSTQLPQARIAANRPSTTVDQNVRQLLDALCVDLADEPSDSMWSVAALLDIGLKNNPTLMSAVARIELVRTDWQRQGLSLKSLVERIEDDSKPASLSLVAIARQDIRRDEEESKAQILRVKNDIRICYFDLLLTQAIEPLAEHLVRLNQDILATIEKQIENREATPIDLLQARRDAHAATILQERVSNRKTASWRHLGALVGTPDITPKPLAGDLAAIVSHTLDEQGALTSLFANSPVVLAARAEVQKTQLQLAKIRADSGANDNSDLRRQDQASPRLLPVPGTSSARMSVKSAEAKLVLAERELATVKLRLHARHADALARYNTANASVNQYASALLPAARNTLNLLQDDEARDKVSAIQVLHAERIYCELSLEYLEALRDLSQAAIELNGFLLTNCLSEMNHSESQ